MPGRKYTSETSYRYGFNGKENDNEVKGEGNQQDYGMRVYDPRIGKFLSVDPISAEYPELSTYQFAGNTPIQATDLDGLEPAYYWEDKEGRWHLSQAADGPLQRKVPPEHRKFLPVATPAEVDNEALSLLLDLTPGIGQVKGIYEGITGKDLVTGKKISDADRAIGVIPYLSKAKKAKTVVKIQKTTNTSKKVAKTTTVSQKTQNTIDRLKETGKKQLEKKENVNAPNTSKILKWGDNAKGHLIKHADVLGFGGRTPQQLQKMLSQLRGAANQLLNSANPASTRVGQWHGHQNAIMYISNGKMLVTESNGTFITVINKTTNQWYNAAKPLK